MLKKAGNEILKNEGEDVKVTYILTDGADDFEKIKEYIKNNIKCRFYVTSKLMDKLFYSSLRVICGMPYSRMHHSLELNTDMLLMPSYEEMLGVYTYHIVGIKSSYMVRDVSHDDDVFEATFKKRPIVIFGFAGDDEPNLILASMLGTV